MQAGLRTLTGLVGTSLVGFLHWWPGREHPFLQLGTVWGGHRAWNRRGPGAQTE